MGMAASQARLLSITSRMADNELRAQIINNSKMRLATESSKASEEYVSALNSATMMMSNYNTIGESQYQKLTFNSLTNYSSYNTQYGLVDANGQLLVSETDYNNFKNAGGNVDDFLANYGLLYTTNYFENLTDADGKTGNAFKFSCYDGGTDSEGKDIMREYTMSELRDMYFGNSTHTGWNNIQQNSSYMDFVDYFNNFYEADAVVRGVVKNQLNDELFSDKGTSIIGGAFAKAFNSKTVRDTTDIDELCKMLQEMDKFVTDNQSYLDGGASAITRTMEINGYDKNKDNVPNVIETYSTITEKYETEDRFHYITHFGPMSAEQTDARPLFYVGSYYEKDKDGENADGSTHYVPGDLEYYKVLYYKYDGEYKSIDLATYNFKYAGLRYNEIEDDKTYEFKAPILDTSGDPINIYEFSIKGVDLKNLLYTPDKKPVSEISLVKKLSVAEVQDAVIAYANDIKSQFVDNLKDLVVYINSNDNVKSNLPTSSQGYLTQYTTYRQKLNELFYGQGTTTDMTNSDVVAMMKDILDDASASTGAKKLAQDVLDANVLDTLFDTYGEPQYGWTVTTANGESNSSENAEAKVKWYTNLFNRMQQGCKVLEDGLASSNEWIQFAFESGLVTMEQVDTENNWISTIYTNCSSITEVTDDTAVAVAEAEYNKTMNSIEAKDQRYDLELKNIDTEHNSLQTEYDSVKSVINKNIERTFKMYS